jgi:tetratricopeptide (TPR) repeat protein
MLRHISVLGAGFQAEHIAAVLPEADDPTITVSLARLDDLVELQPSGWVTFRHALVRDVAYAALPFRVRSRLHGGVADSIMLAAKNEAGDQVALLSLHLVYAQRYGEAWQYARLAGDSATAIYANIEAITLYERALHAAHHLPDLPYADRVDTLERLGDVQELAGLYDASRASYRAARRLLQHDPVRQARLMLKDAFLMERLARYSDAIRAIRRGQRLLDGVAGQLGAQLRAQLAVWYAVIRIDQGKVREGNRWSRAGASLAESAGDEAALARAHLVLGFTEERLGISVGTQHIRRALEISTRLGDLSGQATALNNLGVNAYNHGRWNEAIELYGRSRQTRLSTGDPVNAAMADANTAEIFADQGRLDDAESLWHAAAGVWAAAGDRWGVAFSQRGLGIIAARSERFDEASTLLDEALATYIAMGAYADVLTTNRLIAESDVLAGAGDKALPLLDRMLVDPDTTEGLQPHLPALYRLRGMALLQTGAIDLGRQELDTALAAARRLDDPYQLALTLQALDHVFGGGEDARREYTEILDRLGVVSSPQYPMGSDSP